MPFRSLRAVALWEAVAIARHIPTFGQGIGRRVSGGIILATESRRKE
jgi:hypothetical protein